MPRAPRGSSSAALAWVQVVGGDVVGGEVVGGLVVGGLVVGGLVVGGLVVGGLVVGGLVVGGEVVGGDVVGGDVVGGDVVGGAVVGGEVVGGAVVVVLGGLVVVVRLVVVVCAGVVLLVVSGVKVLDVVSVLTEAPAPAIAVSPCNTFAGPGKPLSGYVLSAVYMKSCQIIAGKLPPVTPIPCTFRMGTRPSGCPTHTAVARCGVKPQNQASEKSEAVPVLPAAGRPIWARVPVPFWTLSSSISLAVVATLAGTAWVIFGCACQMSLPLASQTLVMMVGSTCRPPVARVPYADAISSGLTPYVRPPSTIAGEELMGEVMPIALATFTTFCTPTSMMS
jgi:hypothetical protein